MQYDFLIETYETERLKTLSVWTMFTDEDLRARPHPQDKRGRSFQEQMVHQCVSEDLWFKEILGIDVGAPPLPEREERLEFVRRYADDSGKRLLELRKRHKTWWAEEVTFFDVKRSKAWVMTRRMTHTAHHLARPRLDRLTHAEPILDPLLALVERRLFRHDATPDLTRASPMHRTSPMVPQPVGALDRSSDCRSGLFDS